MGIRFYCPDCGRRLNIKVFLAGKRGICPHCDSRVLIPTESQLPADAPKYRPTSAGASSSPTATALARPSAALPEAIATTDSTQRDPIAESPDSVWYVRPAAGGQYGPARGDVMRRWLTEGRVNADSMVWREGWADWKLAGPVFPMLEAAPSTAPTAAKSTPVKSAPSFLVPGDEEQDISKPVAAPARRAAVQKKSIAPLIILGLLIVVLLIVTVIILRGTGKETSFHDSAPSRARPLNYTSLSSDWNSECLHG